MEEKTPEKVEIKSENLEKISPEKEKRETSPKLQTTQWALIGLGFAAVVATGIWFGLGAEKRFGGTIQQKFFQTKDVTQEATKTATPQGENVQYYQSKKAELLANALKYPGSEQISRKQDAGSLIWVLNSSDSADVVVKYYRDLVALNSWKTVRVGGDTSVIKITQSDFSALVEIDKTGGVTEIKINAEYPNPDEMTSTFKTPAKIEDVTITPSSDENTITGDYILPFSGTRIVNNDDLTGLTPWELKVARNEIYARYGRPFVHKDLTCYFAKQSWYTLDSNYSDESLTEIDVKNVSVILNFEKSINSPLVAKDSGCK